MVYMDFRVIEPFKKLKKQAKQLPLRTFFKNLKSTESSKGQNPYTPFLEMMYMKKNGVYEEKSCIQRDMTFSSKVLDECQRHGRTEERSKLNRKASEGETELVQVDKPLEPNLLQIRKTSARAKTVKCTMELKMNK